MSTKRQYLQVLPEHLMVCQFQAARISTLDNEILKPSFATNNIITGCLQETWK